MGEMHGHGGARRIGVAGGNGVDHGQMLVQLRIEMVVLAGDGAAPRDGALARQDRGQGRKARRLGHRVVKAAVHVPEFIEALAWTLQRGQTFLPHLLDDREMARVPVDEIVAFAREAVAPGSEALFISCTAVRAAGVIDRIEAACGVPVLSSNYAAAWNVLRLCGDPTAAAPGHLMALDLP